VIGLDTNVLLRYLIQDHPVQSPKATIFIRQLSAHAPGFVSMVALAELAWVLERTYRFKREEIAAAVQRLLGTSTLVVESEPQVFAALALSENGEGSLADALIGQLGLKAGCSRSVTFDEEASRRPGFELI
jgi:predicted nucleic-acid-binding protein